jgi:hypothetical protein
MSAQKNRPDLLTAVFRADRMRPVRTLRVVSTLASAGVVFGLLGCAPLVVAHPGDDPERVAASFVSFIGAGKPEDAAGLLYSTPQRPIPVDTDDIHAIRQLAGLPAGCALAARWEGRTKAVKQANRYVVTVPVVCDGIDDSIDVAITTGPDHYVLWE